LTTPYLLSPTPFDGIGDRALPDAPPFLRGSEPGEKG